MFGQGNAGALIFLNDDQRARFLGILNDVKVKTGVKVLAFCPMGNHYHLLIQVGDVPISKVMQRLLSRYAKTFNHEAGRFGHVFRARYGAKRVTNQAYLTTLFRYIHGNPVEEGWVEDPADWKWSSHRQFVGPIRSVLLDIDAALALLGETREEGMRAYRRLMAMPAPKTPIEFDEATAPLRREVPRDVRASLEEIAADVARARGLDVRSIPGRCRSAEISRCRREICLAAERNLYGVSEIAAFLGLSTGSVSAHLRAGR